MNDVSGFQTEPLTDMIAIGAVGANTARIWLRSELPGRVRLEYWPIESPAESQSTLLDIPETGAKDHTACIALPTSGRELKPLQRYGVRAVHVSGRTIGEGRFETAPAREAETPERFSVALMSCNQPFNDDGDSTDYGPKMLRAADACLENHATKIVFTLGDQMYTDYPKGLSLFDKDYFRTCAPRPDVERIEDASAADVRALLQQRYRYFWNFDGWKRLHSQFSCCPIVDDHELVDNWGCDPAHSTEQWRDFLSGARSAYFDYQGSRVSTPEDAEHDFDYVLEYGPLAAYVLDLRSNRRMGDDARILSLRQLANFEDFLSRFRHKQVLLLGLSVPIVHLPRWAANAGRWLLFNANEDFSDRWSTAGHLRDRDRVLSLLREHQRKNPEQRVICLSGDIHIACAHEIRWDDDVPPLIQLISSGITKRVSRITQLASKWSIAANRRIDLSNGDASASVRLMPGEAPYDQNPFTRLNLALLEFRRGSSGRYDTRSLIYGHRDGAPVCVFKSAWG
jgi:alkaline phosphatase D